MARQSIIAGALAVALLGSVSRLGDGQQTAPVAQQGSIPDAPKPQTTLPVNGITPGEGTPAQLPAAPSPAATDPNAPATSLPATAAQETHPDDGPAPEGEGLKAFTLAPVTVNFVQVPFTVKDKHNQLVAGLSWRDVRVYENNVRQHITLWTTDPFPLSVALVIDQSVTPDTMAKINNALGSIEGAFSPYDEVAVFTYNNGPKMQTDFTAAQSARLSAVIERSKGTGREALYYAPGEALSQNININNGAQAYIDPNTNSRHGTSISNTTNVPKEVHTLNDAIFEAAKATAKTGKGRRRIVYVISDGKEYGSSVKSKDVVHYCQENNIAVFATLVHDLPTIPGLGFVDRIHIPFEMRDNLLPQYAAATGGQVDPELRTKGIEQSFARITEQVRTMYTVGYYSHEPFIDGKYRPIDVRVLRTGLTVIAKPGYYPTAQNMMQPGSATTTTH